MGFEMSYQAIPPDCRLLKRARIDEDFGEALGLLPALFRSGHDGAGGPWPALDALWMEVVQLNTDHPGLSKRSAYLDRRWDVLHYLLSASRRGEDAGAADLLMDRALKGGELIAPHVYGCQGVPIRLVSVPEVSQAARLLEPMTCEDLRTHYSPAAMDEAAFTSSRRSMRRNGTGSAATSPSFAGFTCRRPPTAKRSWFTSTDLSWERCSWRIDIWDPRTSPA